MDLEANPRLRRADEPTIIWPAPYDEGCGWYERPPQTGRQYLDNRCRNEAKYEAVAPNTKRYGDVYRVCKEHAARARVEPSILRWMLALRTLPRS